MVLSVHGALSSEITPGSAEVWNLDQMCARRAPFPLSYLSSSLLPSWSLVILRGATPRSARDAVKLTTGMWLLKHSSLIQRFNQE